MEPRSPRWSLGAPDRPQIEAKIEAKAAKRPQVKPRSARDRHQIGRKIPNQTKSDADDDPVWARSGSFVVSIPGLGPERGEPEGRTK